MHLRALLEYVARLARQPQPPPQPPTLARVAHRSSDRSDRSDRSSGGGERPEGVQKVLRRVTTLTHPFATPLATTKVHASSFGPIELFFCLSIELFLMAAFALHELVRPTVAHTEPPLVTPLGTTKVQVPC